MKLDTRALAIVGAALVGGTLCFAAVVNLLGTGYGLALLDVAASIYPGYRGPTGIGSVIVVTLYGLVDGAIGGWIVGWVYNRVARPAA